MFIVYLLSALIIYNLTHICWVVFLLADYKSLGDIILHFVETWLLIFPRFCNHFWGFLVCPEIWANFIEITRNEVKPNKHFVARGTISKDFKIPKSVQADNSLFPFNSSYTNISCMNVKFYISNLINSFYSKTKQKRT